MACECNIMDRCTQDSTFKTWHLGQEPININDQHHGTETDGINVCVIVSDDKLRCNLLSMPIPSMKASMV